MLLAELMLRVYGIQQLPELITLSNGRPCFADPNLPDFSIAYAGGQIDVLHGTTRTTADQYACRAFATALTQPIIIYPLLQ